MHTYANVTKDISLAAQIIAEGRAVAVPTGTSYGLAVDALQGHALQRLRNLKGRAVEKTFTIFMTPALWSTFLDLTKQEKELLEKYDKQALTLLVQPKSNLEHLAQGGRVGLRIIDHPMMKELADVARVPLTATSANISGSPACYSIDCVQKSFPGLLDPTDTRHGDIEASGHTTYDLSLGAILDGGILPEKKPSTIAKIIDGKVQVVREGGVTLR